MNTAGAFLPVSLWFLVPLLILVVSALVHDRMWRRLPQDHPAAHKAPNMYPDTDQSGGGVMQEISMNNCGAAKQLHIAYVATSLASFGEAQVNPS